LSYVNPLLLERVVGLEDHVNKLMMEKEEMKKAMVQMQQQIEMLAKTGA
jgi:hypothetical protein